MYLFMYLFLFLAVLGLRCCLQAFSSAASQAYSLLWCSCFSLQWLLLWSMGGGLAPLVVEHGL